ncbi:MAG: chalcone isomerase family protein [Desulfuromonadales bacterium]
MRKMIFVFAFVLLSVNGAQAIEVAGTDLAPAVEVGGETLQLNGYGIRTKFFFKIYIGSLYTNAPVSTVEEVLEDGAKLIRMNFLYSEVERHKIVDAFAEGFANNSPQMTDTDEVRAFLDWFEDDFIEGDVVDLELAADGTVTVRHNGQRLGSLQSGELARAILLIYLGESPADESLKKGMLGRNRP